jgi:hypothetical protein
MISLTLTRSSLAQFRHKILEIRAFSRAHPASRCLNFRFGTLLKPNSCSFHKRWSIERRENFILYRTQTTAWSRIHRKQCCLIRTTGKKLYKICFKKLKDRIIIIQFKDMKDDTILKTSQLQKMSQERNVILTSQYLENF